MCSDQAITNFSICPPSQRGETLFCRYKPCCFFHYGQDAKPFRAGWAGLAWLVLPMTTSLFLQGADAQQRLDGICWLGLPTVWGRPEDPVPPFQHSCCFPCPCEAQRNLECRILGSLLNESQGEEAARHSHLPLEENGIRNRATQPDAVLMRSYHYRYKSNNQPLHALLWVSSRAIT